MKSYTYKPHNVCPVEIAFQLDGNVVTGTGPGTAALFAAEVLRALGGPASDVSSAMLLR